MVKEKRTGKKIAKILLFIGYLAALSYLLFFAESIGRGASDSYRYNFVPLAEIRRYLTYSHSIGWFGVFINLPGNVLAFLPFGYFLASLSEHRLKGFSVVLFSMEFSIFVELLQLVTRLGSCDVDDVILNTLGGWIGYLIYWFIHRTREQNVRGERTTKKTKKG